MTTEDKAQALLNEVVRDWGEAHVVIPNTINRKHDARCEALCRAIEQHEAFRQEVSDAVEAYLKWSDECFIAKWDGFDRFIIPKPKPDPLVEVLLEMDLSSDLEEGQHDAKWLRIKLDALGFEIREKGQ